MLISEQFKIAIKMLLTEADVSVVDEYGQTMLAATLNGTQYILDTSTLDPLQAWLDVDRGQVAPNTIQQQLYNMASKDPDHTALLQQSIRQIKQNSETRRRRPKRSKDEVQAASGEISEEWFQKYVAGYEAMENLLVNVPHELGTVFKHAGQNYMMYDDPAQDWVAIMPTPSGMMFGWRSGEMGAVNRAVYVLRKNANKTIPQLGIREGMPYTIYITKLAEQVGTNLLQIRDALVQAGLGMAFRRDTRIETVTQWIPSGLFETFDQFRDTANNVREQIQTIASTITEDV